MSDGFQLEGYSTIASSEHEKIDVSFSGDEISISIKDVGHVMFDIATLKIMSRLADRYLVAKDASDRQL